MSFCRQLFDSSWLRPACALSLLLASNSAESNSFDAYFPRGQYPSLADVQPTAEEGEANSTGLVGEIKTLSSEITKSVKEVSQKRNFTCFGDPCLVQVFPLAYSKPNSGFFGGFRSKITNISRQNPFVYVVDTQIIRSDSAQWLASVNVDIPQIELRFLRPRLKLRGSYARSTEFRYTGEGKESLQFAKRPDEDKRYSLRENSAGGTVLIPLTIYNQSKFGLYGSYDYSQVANSPFRTLNSLLFDEQPRSYTGGTFRSLGGGIFFDDRPTETLTRSGGMLEIGLSVGKLDDDRAPSYRFTFVDRSYHTKRRWTLAHRLTMDGIFGKTPFWEAAGVGGIDPIRDISGSGILKAYTGGRFHENFKIIESLELRVHQNEFRILGARGDLAVMPLAVDIGVLSRLVAWSLATGVDVIWNRAFYTRFYTAFTESAWAMRLRFAQDF